MPGTTWAVDGTDLHAPVTATGRRVLRVRDDAGTLTLPGVRGTPLTVPGRPGVVPVAQEHGAARVVIPVLVQAATVEDLDGELAALTGLVGPAGATRTLTRTRALPGGDVTVTGPCQVVTDAWGPSRPAAALDVLCMVDVTLTDGVLWEGSPTTVTAGTIPQIGGPGTPTTRATVTFSGGSAGAHIETSRGRLTCTVATTSSTVVTDTHTRVTTVAGTPAAGAVAWTGRRPLTLTPGDTLTVSAAGGTVTVSAVGAWL